LLQPTLALIHKFFISPSEHNQQFYFRGGIAAIALLSILTRFWQLDGVADIVFDEVYYPKYAQAYLNGTVQFDAHPPLGKYLIALGIQVWGYNPIGYRWITALIGSLVPILTCSLVYVLSDRRSWALLVGLFTACDGLLLVESRYGLINTFMVAFGLLSQICIFKALRGWIQHHQDLSTLAWRSDQTQTIQTSKPRLFFNWLSWLSMSSWWLWLLAAGIFLGAAVSVKWNGLAYLVGMAIAVVMAMVRRHQAVGLLKSQAQQRQKQNQAVNQVSDLAQSADQSENLGKYRRDWLSLWAIGGLGLLIVPIGMYLLAWLPHLHLSTNTSLVNEHGKIWEFHQKLGEGATEPIHPYCSPWWSWLLTLRSISYFYEELPNGVVRVVTALGNPFLYWLSAIAMLLLCLLLLHRLWTYLESRFVNQVAVPKPWQQVPWLPVYIVGSFAAHLLPWSLSSRCTFLYLYMPASIYAFMAIALIIERCWQRGGRIWPVISFAMIAAVIFAFIYWLPIYLGLPIPEAKFRSLMWLDSWI
jgi:dolichyl-phosphate-mannose-protein mannosyltransferase